MSWLNFQLCIYCIASIYKYYIELIIKNQFGRRNLPAYERAKLALRLKPIVQAKAKENKIGAIEVARQSNSKVKDKLLLNQKSDKTEKTSTDKELAKIAGVSHDTIYKVEIIEKEATEEQKQALSKGEKKVKRYYQIRNTFILLMYAFHIIFK